MRWSISALVVVVLAAAGWHQVFSSPLLVREKRQLSAVLQPLDPVPVPVDPVPVPVDLVPVPVDPVPAPEWSDWTTCSAECGIPPQGYDDNPQTSVYGWQSRTFANPCDTSTTPPSCTISTQWGQCNRKACGTEWLWQSWSQCSADCGGGQRTADVTYNGDSITVGIPCNTQRCDDPIPCARARVVFVLDSSGSLGDYGWALVKQFAIDVSKSFPLGPDQVDVGVVSFASEVHVEIPFGTFNMDFPELVDSGIGGLPFLAGSTNTQGGIHAAREMFEGDDYDGAQVMIVVTDGKSNIEEENTPVEADLARAQGIIVYAVGVGAGTDLEELKLIANEPPEAHIFQQGDINTLSDITQSLTEVVCDATIEESCRPWIWSECSVSCGTGTQTGTRSCETLSIRSEGIQAVLETQTQEVGCSVPCVVPTPPIPSLLSRSTSSLTVYWSPSDTTTTGYSVSRSGSDEDIYVPFNGEGTLQATFQGLTAGEFYTIYLQAMAQNVASDASQASYYTTPAAVEESLLSLTSVSTDGFTVEWQFLEASGYYDQFRVGLEGVTGSQTTVSGEVTPLTASFDSLTAGTPYTVQIVTVSGDQSSEVAQQTYHTRPNPPNGVTQESTTDTITLSWLPPEGGFDGYYLSYSQEGSPLSTSQSISADATQYILGNLLSGVLYEVTLVSTADTGASEPVTFTTATTPNRPTSVTGGVSTTSIRLAWTAPEGAFDGYTLSYSPEGDATPTTVQISGTLTGYEIQNLVPGTTYELALSSYTQYGTSQLQSGAVAPMITTRPTPPTQFSAESSTSTSVTLIWTAPSEGEFDSYRLHYRRVGDIGTPTVQDISSTAETTYTLTGLGSGEEYYITLFSVSAGVQSDGVQLPTASTRPTQPIDVSFEATESSIHVFWTAAEGPVDDYIITYGISGDDSAPTEVVVSATATEYIILNLEPGTEYDIQLFSRVGEEVSTPLEYTVSTKPVAPGPIGYEETAEGTVRFTWPAIEDATYTIDIFNLATGESVLGGLLSLSTNEYTAVLESGVQYFVGLFSVVNGVSSEQTSLTFTTSEDITPMGIRLAGGGSDGRLEVSFGGEWGTVCDVGFDITDAAVACIQLGFSGALGVDTSVAPGVGHIFMADVACTGAEVSLGDCPHTYGGDDLCTHDQDVGISCIPHNIDVDCSQCTFVAGLGYLPDPSGDCAYHYVCQPLENGEYLKYRVLCGAGTIWDQDAVTCVHPEGHLPPGCIASTGGHDTGYWGPEAGCYLSADQNDPTRFYVEGHSTPQSCAPGTVFRQEECGCGHGDGPVIVNPRETCIREGIRFPFEADFQSTSGIAASNDLVVLDNGLGVGGSTAASFNGASHLEIEYFRNNWFSLTGDPHGFTISFWVHHDQTSGVEGVINNGNCEQAPSVRIRYDQGIMKVGVDTDSTGMEEITIWWMPADQWNHVAVTYDGVTLSVYTNGGPYNSITLNSPVEPRQCSMVVGLETVGTEAAFFTGSIDELRFYKCALEASDITLLYNSPITDLLDLI